MKTVVVWIDKKISLFDRYNKIIWTYITIIRPIWFGRKFYL